MQELDVKICSTASWSEEYVKGTMEELKEHLGEIRKKALNGDMFRNFVCAFNGNRFTIHPEEIIKESGAIRLLNDEEQVDSALSRLERIIDGEPIKEVLKETETDKFIAENRVNQVKERLDNLKEKNTEIPNINIILKDSQKNKLELMSDEYFNNIDVLFDFFRKSFLKHVSCEFVIKNESFEFLLEVEYGAIRCEPIVYQIFDISTGVVDAIENLYYRLEKYSSDRGLKYLRKEKRKKELSQLI